MKSSLKMRMPLYYVLCFIFLVYGHRHYVICSSTSWPKWAFNTSAILLSNRVLGNAMKLRQWIEGALETAEEVVNKYMGKL